MSLILIRRWLRWRWYDADNVDQDDDNYDNYDFFVCGENYDNGHDEIIDDKICIKFILFKNIIW